MISNVTPVKWSPTNAELLYNILMNCKGNFLIPQIRLTWPNLDEKFASNLEKLLISLHAYYDSNNPLIPEEELFTLICSKQAAELLKNIRTKSIMMTWGSTFVEEPDWWNSTPHYILYDIGDVFYYKYCFFWEEDNDDYKYQLEPLSVKKGYKKKFREATIAVLDECNFDFDFESTEILFQPRSSKIIDENFESVNDFEVRYEKYPTYRFGKRLPGKRSVVPVHPGGVRDTIINQLPDLNTIMAIDRITGLCLKNHANTVLNNVESFQRKLEKFHDKYEFFYCRDITKEGITKPKYLLQIMLEELSKRCKYFSEVCSTDFFKGDWCQLEDGTVIKSKRGHGLGMGNSLTTLMQIIIYRMTLIKYVKNHNLSDDFCDFFAMNDDCVFGLNLEEEEAFEFSQLDHEVLENLGLIRKKTKSFIAKKAFVFLEIYFPSHLNKKESIVKRTMLLPYSAVNITHAKDLMSFLGNNPYIDIILHKWGYEFYPNEINYPRHLGGWFSKNFYGVDISLDIQLEEFTSQMSRAAQAVMFSDMKFKRRLISNNDPLNLLPYSDIDDYILNKLPVAGSRLFSTFERLKIRSDFNVLYDQIYKKRASIYEKSKYLDLKTYINLLRESSDRDIFISEEAESWIRDFDITIFPNGFSDPYRYNSPISSAIRKLKGIDIKGLPSSYWPITHSDASFTCSVLRSEMAEMNLDYFAFTYTDEDVVLPNDPIEFNQFLESWKNPIAVAKYCQLRFNKLMIPSRVPSVIKYKKDFFARRLSKDEYIFLQGRSYSTITKYLNSDIDVYTFLEELDIEEEPGVPATIDIHVEEEDSFPMTAEENRIMNDIINLFTRTKVPISTLLPEGWEISSFEEDENILYVMDNQELFDSRVLDYVDLNYDLCIRKLKDFLFFMSWADPDNLGIKYTEMKEEILESCRYLRLYVESHKAPKRKETASEESVSEEADFLGDFDFL